MTNLPDQAVFLHRNALKQSNSSALMSDDADDTVIIFSAACCSSTVSALAGVQVFAAKLSTTSCM